MNLVTITFLKILLDLEQWCLSICQSFQFIIFWGYIFRKYNSKKQLERRGKNVVVNEPELSDLHDDVTERTSLLDDVSSQPKEITLGSISSAGSGADVKDAGRPRFRASLFKALVRTYGPDLFRSWLCKLVYDLLQFVNPQLLK